MLGKHDPASIERALNARFVPAHLRYLSHRLDLPDLARLARE